MRVILLLFMVLASNARANEILHCAETVAMRTTGAGDSRYATQPIRLGDRLGFVFSANGRYYFHPSCLSSESDGPCDTSIDLPGLPTFTISSAGNAVMSVSDVRPRTVSLDRHRPEPAASPATELFASDAESLLRPTVLETIRAMPRKLERDSAARARFLTEELESGAAGGGVVLPTAVANYESWLLSADVRADRLAAGTRELRERREPLARQRRELDADLRTQEQSASWARRHGQRDAEAAYTRSADRLRSERDQADAQLRALAREESKLHDDNEHPALTHALYELDRAFTDLKSTLEGKASASLTRLAPCVAAGTNDRELAKATGESASFLKRYLADEHWRDPLRDRRVADGRLSKAPASAPTYERLREFAASAR